MSITTVHPRLSDLLPLERIPNGLEGLRDGIADVMGNIFVKDLIVSKSFQGDTGFYNLKIVTRDGLSFNIPFAGGLKLAFNPSNEGTTEIPLNFEYSWGILRYIDDFSLTSFDNAVDSILYILFDLIQIEPSTLLKDAIFEFYPNSTAVVDFVQNFNTSYDETLQASTNSNLTAFQKIDLIFEEIEDKDFDTLEVIYNTIINFDGEDAIERLKRLFSRYITDVDETIKDLIEVQFRVSINEISLGLQFPRNWLSPVYTGEQEVSGLAIDEPLPESFLSTLKYNAGRLIYSSESGFQFDEISNFSFTRSEIGNTGLIAEFEGLKLDLSNNSNIPEAIADGRAEDFKGVYAEFAEITLPKKWFKKSETADTARISGHNLLIGTGGLSGTIALEVLLAEGTITDYYSDKFALEYPVTASRTNPETKVLEISILNNHAELVTHYNIDRRINFVYPISLTDTSSSEFQTFKNAGEYNRYLASEQITPTTPRIGFEVGGFELGLTSFDITFSQGSIVETNIKGLMQIPLLKDGNGNDAEVIVTGHLDDEGNFSLTLSEEDGLRLGIPGVADLIIHSLAYIREEGRGFVEVAADIAFTNGVVTKILCDPTQTIPLPTMRFYAKPGGFEIVGGTIAVPESFSLCLGPVDVSVTGISQGAHQRMHDDVMRDYKYWGFDGAISINPLGLDVRGDGLKFYHTIDDEEKGLPRDAYVHIRALGVDLIIPGDASPKEAAVIIKGYLSLPEPGESPEYEGSVTAKIGKIGITASAEMRLAPKHPAFIIDANVNLKTGIPIGATGLEITAFRGLFGYRYVAEKEAVGLTSGNIEDTWYDYYVFPKRGVNVKKFNTPDKTGRYKNPVSIGAGATINTKGVNVVSTRVMLLLSIPSLFVIDGRASIISKKWGLDDSGEPPFFAFLAIGDQSVELGVGADFKIPQKSGLLVSVKASVEAAFFFRDPSAWYVYVGRKDQPNEGKVLNILTAQTYLELSARGIELGARAEFIFNKRFGPAKIKAWLFVEVGGKLSFERPQIGGYFEAGGGFEIKVWIISASVSFNAILAVEAPKPFLIRAEVRVCARVKIGFIKVRKCVKVEIKWEFNKQVDRTPVLPYPPIGGELALEQIQGIHMLTGETFSLVDLPVSGSLSGNDARFNQAILPLDTYIDIKFLKGLSISDSVKTLIGGVTNPPVDNIELIPPEKTVKGGHTVRQVYHKYKIEEIEVQAWAGTKWVDYNPFEAVTAKDDTTEDFSGLKIGHWQKTRKAYDQIRLMATNPFTYTEQGEDGWYIPEELGITPSTLFCEGQFRPFTSVNWVNRTAGERYHVPFTNPQQFFNIGQLYFQILGTGILGDEDFVQPEFGEVASEYSNFNFIQSLKIPNTNGIALKFTNSAQSVNLKVTSTARGVHFRFYKAVFEETNGTPVVSYELIEGGEVYKLSSELYNEFSFTSESEPIDRVEIDPETPNEEEIDRIREEIAILLNGSGDGFSDVSQDFLTISDLSLNAEDQARYDQLISELEEARSIGCDMSVPPPRGIGAMQIGGILPNGENVEGTFIVGVDAFESDGIDLPTSTGEPGEKCFTLLHEVQWISVIDFAYNEEIPGQEEINADFMNSVDAVTQVAHPIWRPDTSYRVNFSVSDEVDNDRVHTFPYSFGFKTAGPIGHYHNAPNVTYGGARDSNGLLLDPDKYDLASLRNYIDYERSYPNANGSLLQAKPMFYGTEGGNNEIRLFFNKPYLNHMLDRWGAYQSNGGTFPELSGRMQVVIKDPTEDITLNNPPLPDETNTEIASSTGAWEEDDLPQLPPHVIAVQNMLDGLNSDDGFTCRLELGQKITPKSYNRNIQINDLKPQKLYTAIVNSYYIDDVIPVPVHNFNFQTSRYKDFAEQVNSYQLKDEDGNVSDYAVYDLPIAASATQIDTAYDLVNGGIDPNQNAAEADPFDRVIEGLLGIKPMDPAATTEFNRLKNEEGAVIGILIRNPEPFNNPNIPREVIKGEVDHSLKSISVLNASEGDNDVFKILYAKDYAQCLIMKEEDHGGGVIKKQISNTELNILFRYLKWNGNGYSSRAADQIIVSNLTINNQ